jgi:hypothetical protein
MDFEKYIELKLKSVEADKENQEFTLKSPASLSLS